jgi:2-polyprenyl-3-methyl-5-hydroxy-6-metoxy-1,4-benzoquinol methylase
VTQETAQLRGNGWDESARAYIDFIDRGESSREALVDEHMLRLCGDVRGLRTLDVGCGEGRFVRMLADRGADSTGIDATGEMVRTAVSRGPQPLALADAARLPFRDARFDLVISYIVLVDVEDWCSAIAEMARVLRPGGSIVVANVGFVTASYGWERDADGRRLYHKVDRYAEEWSQVWEWSGIRVRNWHRPLSAYMQAYLGAGLTLREFLEPVPQDDSLRDDTEFEDWYRIPQFTVMKWQKQASSHS